MHEADKLRAELPEIGFNVFGPHLTHGIPTQLFGHVQALCRGKKQIQAIRELRTHLGWSLKDAKDFVDRYMAE